MSSPDLNQLMEQARKAQSRLTELQRELATRRVEGSAGGGMVKAVVSGDLRVLEVRFEDGLLTAGDREMLQDLTAAAVNSALANAQRMIQQEMQRASGGLNLADLGSA